MKNILLLITIVFCIFIICFGAYYLWHFRIKTKELRKILNEAIQKIPDSSSYQDCRNKFAQNYHNINNYFKSPQFIFSHPWIEFTEQLIEPENNKEQVFQNSIRPENFFTLEYLLKARNINSKLMESMPGMLVGLGVLGTFIGLIVSLGGLLNLKEIENIKEALDSIISGASMAFWTSVVGLFSSLAFNFISDHRISKLQTLLNRFNSILEKCLKFVTEEHLLTMHLEEMRQQGKYLENMDEKIATKIGDIIEKSSEKIGGKIQSAISEGNQNISEKFLSDMGNRMSQGIGDFSQKQRENVEQILSALQESIPPLVSRLEAAQKKNEEGAGALLKNLEETTKSLMGHMESSIKSLTEHLALSSAEKQNQINRSLSESINSMKSDFVEIGQNLRGDMAQTLSDSSGAFKKLLTDLGEINKDILQKKQDSESVYKEQMEQVAGQLNSFAEHLGQIIAEIRGPVTESLQSAISRFQLAADKQEEISSKNEDYIHSIDNLSQSLQDAASAMSKAHQKLPDFIRQISQSNDFLQDVWRSYEKRFEDIDEEAAKIFTKIKDGLVSVSEESAKFIYDLNNQTSQFSNHLAQAVEELKEVVDSFNDSDSASASQAIQELQKIKNLIEEFKNFRR